MVKYFGGRADPQFEGTPECDYKYHKAANGRIRFIGAVGIQLEDTVFVFRVFSPNMVPDKLFIMPVLCQGRPAEEVSHRETKRDKQMYIWGVSEANMYTCHF